MVDNEAIRHGEYRRHRRRAKAGLKETYPKQADAAPRKGSHRAHPTTGLLASQTNNTLSKR